MADPHEIANVCGTDGINFLMESVNGLPLHVYFLIPSCVPATLYDENGATLKAKDIKTYYKYENVLGLAEVMNYYGVVNGDKDIMHKISDAKSFGKKIDGHAPLLSGEKLETYIAAGIRTDHECSNADEAIEKLRKGQWIMVRKGSSARNLNNLLMLFDEPYFHRCLLVTDDRHPTDIIEKGHIDNIIREAVKAKKSVVNAIRMGTINAATCFGINNVGAVAPGYRADILILDSLDDFEIRDVYSEGIKVVENKKVSEYEKVLINKELEERVRKSFHLQPLKMENFEVKMCYVNFRFQLPDYFVNFQHMKLQTKINRWLTH